MSLVKGYAKDAISQNADIPGDKQDLAVNTAVSALGSGIKDNLPDLVGLLGGSSGGNSLMNSLQSTVSNALVSKVGLSSTVSSVVASTLVPMVVKAISGKVSDPDEKGFNLESIVSAFSGEGKEHKSGILGALSNLLGK